ncbi:MAG TPA: nicotinamide-nucleotide amidohydrolase family protein [Gammaproteobacteria bacterium]|nr:nicotinamide-nucleotide amidohydrolase family protein [Gammaproteobacteria bacterium]
MRMATAESCTGGWIAKAVTDVPGSSQWFEGGVVAYSNALKTSLLGVAPALIDAHGAVSEPVVRAMADAARARLGAAARALVEQRFTLHRMVAAHLALYATVLEQVAPAADNTGAADRPVRRLPRAPARFRRSPRE